MDDQSHHQAPRRVAVACAYCRKRKRRCDRAQPVCSLCRDTNRRCIYQQPPVSDPASSGPISAPDRLVHLESVLAEHTRVLHSIEGSLRERADTVSTASPVFPATLSGHRPGNVARTENVNASAETGRVSFVDYLAPMTIPLGHATTTSSLLQLKPVRALIGEYPNDLFLRVEQRRSLPDELSFEIHGLRQCLSPALEASTCQVLLDQYFEKVHPIYPILERKEVESIYELQNGITAECTTESALLMMVLAVAQLSTENFPQPQDRDWPPGVSFFRPSVQYLLRTWPMQHHTDVHLSQAMFLVALYYTYLCRPLQAWRMLHMAATNIQHAILQSQCPGNENQALIRTCWGIFIMECDLVAEYHLPRSGIENLVDQLPFPDPGDSPQSYISSWLANISARKLLNRIHYTIYKNTAYFMNTDSSGNPNQILRSLYVLSDELTHQLETSWEVIPSSAKPNLTNHDSDLDLGEAALMLRYHACGDIICRPFLYHLCSQSCETSSLDDGLLSRALRCLDHSREFIRIVPIILERFSPKTEMCLHSTLAAIINLTVAFHCSILRDYVSDIESLEERARSVVKRWAFSGTSAEMILRLLLSLGDKRMLLVSLTR